MRFDDRPQSPWIAAITFGTGGFIVVGHLITNSLGVNLGPLVDGPQYEFEDIWGCVVLPLVTVGGLVMFYLLNRYGRGDDDTDLSDIY